MRATFVGGAALVTVVVAALSQQVLYEWLVVPRLADLRQVPVAWWVGLAAPIIIVALTSGWLAKSWGETLVAAILGTLGLQTYGMWLAQTGRAGWFKSFAVEAPLEYWTLGTLQVLVLVAVLTLIGHACRRKTAAASLTSRSIGPLR
jgi:hypothetical protein